MLQENTLNIKLQLLHFSINVFNADSPGETQKIRTHLVLTGN